MKLSGMLKTLSALLILPGVVVLPVGHIAVAQSSSQPTRPQETRPRRSTDPQKPEEPQDDKPIRLSADLVTVLASVSDPAGNLVSDLSREDFEIYEDNAQQELAGLYREEQKSLQVVFLFDTSGSIRSRFDFEKRAAASAIIRRKVGGMVSSGGLPSMYPVGRTSASVPDRATTRPRVNVPILGANLDAQCGTLGGILLEVKDHDAQS